MKEEITKSYYAVIPADVRYHPSFKGGDPRLLYGEISALCNDQGFCWASNEYFANLYNVKKRAVQRWIKELQDAGFIHCEVKGMKRKIFLANIQPDPDVEEEPKKKPAKKKAKKKTETKELKPKYSDEDLKLAEYLLSKIIYNFPVFENKKVKIDDWADEMRKLREIDKASPQQIEFMITWVHGGEYTLKDGTIKHFEQNDFWAQNIMSARKLRKQWFENLVPKLQETMKKTIKKTTTVKM